MKLFALTVAVAGLAVPASATTCPAEASLRADPRWRDGDCHHCIINRVYAGPGTMLRWNGARVNLATLRHYLTIVHEMEPEPFTTLVIGPGADCGLIARVRDLVERTQACSPGYLCSFGLAAPRRPPASRARSRR